eukprot:TRINITY_DN14098_c0_g2_i1.p1 TRINITY_DN14098_c0_g2~~TRINITY_DN14098_c0_g2_i1.p1  ORF type:complete len:439 (-),score=101.17 TRINITY_DN14098_c0_g2_i1:300-1616(-)
MTEALAGRFDFLQDRARRPIRDTSLDVGSSRPGRTNIGHLKEFYLERLAKKEPEAAARLGGYVRPAGGSMDISVGSCGGQPQASGQTAPTHCLSNRPAFGAAMSTQAPPPVKDIEDLEIMCNNCFALVKMTEAVGCSGDTENCGTAQRLLQQGMRQRAENGIGLLDYKLRKIRAALETRLQDTDNKVNVMRHLTQLRYHIDACSKWKIGSSDIGPMSDHTVQQVKQLTATSRVLAPAVHVFSRRIENIVIQKERELRRLQVTPTKEEAAGAGGYGAATLPVASVPFEQREDREESVADVNSIVSEMDSDCGTHYAETVLTQDSSNQIPTQQNDVGNMNDANEYLSLKSEDEQRRWFYSQCLTVKLQCSDKAKARKTLISDLYARVKQDKVPIEGWAKWIRKALLGDDEDAAASTTAPPSVALDATQAVPPAALAGSSW